MTCEDCQDTGRLWNKPCPCQATEKVTRACVKCHRRLELTSSNFEPMEKTICNQGFSWHCRNCMAQLV